MAADVASTAPASRTSSGIAVSRARGVMGEITRGRTVEHSAERGVLVSLRSTIVGLGSVEIVLSGLSRTFFKGDGGRARRGGIYTSWDVLASMGTEAGRMAGSSRSIRRSPEVKGRGIAPMSDGGMPGDEMRADQDLIPPIVVSNSVRLSRRILVGSASALGARGWLVDVM